MFIGNFIHEPNYQTVVVLKKYWNKLRKRLPKTELHIYGAYPPQKVVQLHYERSEERRVGKEWRGGGALDEFKDNGEGLVLGVDADHDVDGEQTPVLGCAT